METIERDAGIRQLFDANLIGIWTEDLSGPILEANDVFLKMFGYDRSDLAAGLNWQALIPPDLRQITDAAAAQFKAYGKYYVAEREYLRKDGTRVHALVWASTLDEHRTRAIVFAIDMTERKRAEEERETLRRAQADLAHLNRVTKVGELTAALAHEIKQPLAATISNANACLRWLKRDTPDLNEACEAASRIISDIGRANEIIEHVRKLVGKGTARRSRVDINQLIGEMCLLLGPQANRGSVIMGTRLAEGRLEAMADRVQLQQVLMNLMLNAIEAMTTGGELTVESERRKGDELLVSVRDTGPGIAPDQMHRVFETFFTTKAEGTGMGLSISRSIVESHGGRLEASANSAGGAVFFFTLPIAGVDDESLPTQDKG